MTKYLLLVAAAAVALVAYLSMIDGPPQGEAPNPAHVRNTGEWGTSR